MATQDGLVQSLRAAADAAQQAYNEAQVQNPAADLSQLYRAEVNAQTLYLDALNKSFTGDSGADAIDAQLQAITGEITANLNDLKSVNEWVTMLDKLVNAATSVAGLFA